METTTGISSNSESTGRCHCTEGLWEILECEVLCAQYVLARYHASRSLPTTLAPFHRSTANRWFVSVLMFVRFGILKSREIR